MIKIPVTIKKKPLGNFRVNREIYSQLKKGLLDYENTSSTISILIRNKIENSYDISRAIKETYYKIKGHYPSVDNFKIKIHLQVASSFDILNIDNVFPQEVFFDKCTGKQLNVKTDSFTYFSQELENPINLHLFQCNIENINIESKLNILNINDLKDCNKFIFLSKNSTPIKMKFCVISGNFNEIEINQIFSESISLKINKDNNDLKKESVLKIEKSNLENLILESEVNLSIELNKNDIKKIDFSSLHQAKEINFKENNINTLKIIIPKLGIDKVSLEENIDLKHITIRGLKSDRKDYNLNTLSINNCSFSSDFIGSFSDLKVKRISLNHLINRGEINFTNIEIEELFEIKNSIIGKSIFLNSNTGKKLELLDSNIEDIKLFSTDLSEDISFNKNEDLKKIKDGYRQLKIIFDKSSNNEKAIFFRHKELKTYYLTLSFFKRRQVLEKITLLFNRYSNKHTLNWGYPIFWIFIVGTITFFSFLFSLNAFEFYEGKVFIVDSRIYSSYFDWFIPSYLYPTKAKFNLLLDCFNYSDFSALPFASKAITIINDTLLMPYLIYQFIAAFRRHGSK
ncbi:hypothetical protein [Arundinibacter roseus]|uniref:Uncharacterized protein n=1 Tax=Arundinibacter roseus TaxID=2070510 RepID=A0A4R4KL84_9BACT|nr:hypothetical protein [Arundinibacter roseus]TDB69107.1 hypothetical protein EZE20_01870 [Arundinibacter roseus]